MRVKLLILFGLLGLVFAILDSSDFVIKAAQRINPPLGKNPLFRTKHNHPNDPLMYRTAEQGVFFLEMKDVFLLKQEESKRFKYNQVTFSLYLSPNDIQHLDFKAHKGEAYRLTLSADPSVASNVSYVKGKKNLGVLAHNKKQWRPPVNQWLECALYLSNHDFSFEVNKTPVFSFNDKRRPMGAVSFYTEAGKPRIDKIGFEAFSKGKVIIEQEDFEVSGAYLLSNPLGRILGAMGFWAVMILGFCGWLSLTGSIGFKRRLYGVILLFIPCCLLYPLKFFDLPSGCVLLLPMILGVGYGLLQLPRLRFLEHEEKNKPLPFVLGFILFGLVFLVATLPFLKERIPWSTGSGSKDIPLSPAYQMKKPHHLDLSNRFSVNNKYRDFVLEGEILLEPQSLVEIRFREDDSKTNYLCMQVSTTDAIKNGWCKISRLNYEQIPTQQKMSGLTGRWTAFKVQAKGCVITGELDHKPLPRIIDSSMERGSVAGLAFNGAARIRSVRITPLPWEEGAMPTPFLVKKVFPTLGVLLLLAFVFPLLITMKRRDALFRFAAMDFLTHLPPAVILLLLYFGLSLSQTVVTIVLIVFLLGRYAPIIANGRALGVHALILGILLPITSSAVLYSAVKPEIPLILRVNHLAIYDHPTPLDRGFYWMQIPKLKRWNLYFRNHCFRDRNFKVQKPEGVFRIVCMGSSSTFGHLMPLKSGWDFPTVLEKNLNQGARKKRYEVINGGVRGGTSTSVYEYYKGVLRKFNPDLLIINLFYNDAYIQASMDENAYLEKLEETDGDPGLFYLWTTKIKHRWDDNLFQKHSHSASKGGAYPEGFFSKGSDSFKNLILKTIRTAKKDGVKVLLVKEPYNKGRGDFSSPYYYAALDEAAKEENAPVVKPLDYLNKRFKNLNSLYMDAVHFSKKGNQVMAGFLAKTLRDLNLLQ